MTLHAHTLLAAQTHRRMVDPISWAKRARPFVIERAPVASDASPASPPPECAAAVEAGCGAPSRKGRR